MLAIADSEILTFAKKAVSNQRFIDYAKNYLKYKGQPNTIPIRHAKNQVAVPEFMFKARSGLKSFRFRISQDFSELIVDVMDPRGGMITSYKTFKFKEVMDNGLLKELGLTTHPDKTASETSTKTITKPKSQAKKTTKSASKKPVVKAEAKED
ncbi:hypothetical protein GPK34_00440 [Secundilactobacillus kimchicus]|uniref:hypothetical protein n=1 Tax=Secundilactobacillus kimchicus TaxID=528209 RepID=UPI001C015E80|nr:hypothetical protein [Secundilactobacillus kimchicus]MBT9670505.1 hypothetical protein [Secundilactobacillus kimchicus]